MTLAIQPKRLLRLAAGLALLGAGCSHDARKPADGEGFAGSASCRECHEPFYALWATSHHGLAMQPVTEAFARQALTAQTNAVAIGKRRFRADTEARVLREEGPDGPRAYPMVQALGGKNVYYLLTPLERGRLQVLPLAYDVQAQAWINAAASMVRHFAEGTDEALDWRDPLLTFNTACFGCHVSQLSKNYDLKTDTYRTVWREPGINCESCHGPGAEHIRVCRAAPTNAPPKDLKLISMRTMTARQRDETCASCHAKMRPVTASFMPGDRFFDHFDLVGFESPDFYPDGRDLGENYTYTLWLTSPCVRAGRLECLHCHTSSGRNRFPGEKANESCLPCHAERVAKAAEHTHHPAGSAGSRCVACHMPTTTFARMRRTDHSMRPPAPAATLAYRSPNACAQCHADKGAKWADAQVRKWHPQDYQAPVLRRAGLIDTARRRDWSRLDEMLASVGDAATEPVFAASLLRLLEPCDAPRKWPAARQALKHPHPLVRAAAAQLLAGDPGRDTFGALLAAAKDDSRIVRVAAAAALAPYPRELLELPSAQTACDAAFRELENSFLCFPDSWSAHYNRGNYCDERGWPAKALASYAQAMRLRPDVIPPMVNASMVYARQGDIDAAVNLLKKAERLEPKHPAVNLNLGMALAELGRMDEAERHLRSAVAADPASAQAAYNLGVLLNRGEPTDEGVGWCRKAAGLLPQNASYVYTYAYYLVAQGRKQEAAAVLQGATQRGVTSDEITALQGRLRNGK